MPRSAPSQPPPSAAAAPARPRLSPAAVAAAVGLIIAVGVVAYLPSLSAAFVYDDHPHILDNLQIHKLWPIGAVLSHTERPIVYLTLAINYAVGGLDPRGYHVANLAIHVLAALTLFAVLAATFRGPRLARHFGASAVALAAAAALIWVAHPLQTQAVTYAIQRGESLAGWFFLLTLHGVIRGDASERRAGWWYVSAVAACALGMGTKPVMVTAPIAVFLYDRVFLCDSWRDVVARRGVWYAALAATWGILAYVVVTAPNETAGFRIPIPPLAYAASQPGVILHYLRLAFWPHPLVFDYGWRIARDAGAIVPPAMAVVGLIAATAWALARWAPLGYLGVWFFLLLAPTSSIMPIKDLAYEHRMYLPLAAVVVLAITGAHALLDRFGPRSPRARSAVGLVLVALAVVPLGIATAQRNRDYRTEEGLWRDVIAKRPDNPLGYEGMASTYMLASRDDLAFPWLQETLRHDPTNMHVHINLGIIALDQGRAEEALREFDYVAEEAPGSWSAHYNRGVALVQVGRYADAVASYRRALQLRPNDPTTMAALEVVRGTMSRLEASTARYLSVLRELPAERGATFEEVASARPGADLKIEKTYRRLVNGSPVGTIQVLLDFTGEQPRASLETQGQIPAVVKERLAEAVRESMARLGAEEVQPAGTLPRAIRNPD